MRISVTIFIILISTYVANASVLDPVIENVIHLTASKPPPGVSGIWKKKTIWKPRWVKEWKSAKVMKPVWRKVWSPVQIREWLPIPKPPPGWDLFSTPLSQVQPKPQKPQDSQGHDSFAVHTSAQVPLWDPVPYPESQQPPPAPQTSPDATCGKDGCDNSSSHTFNHQQIQEIIGPRYQTTEPYQSPEYSETVNHLTRLPPDNWRHQDYHDNFSGLPDYLVPPKFQPLPQNNFRQPLPGKPNTPVVPPWTPIPPENKIKGHFITKAPDQPYKFQIPEPRNNASSFFQNSNVLKEKPNLQTHNASAPIRADGDFIQEAQLVGEYHYSEFDLDRAKQEANKQQKSPQNPQQNPQEVKVRSQQNPQDVRVGQQQNPQEVKIKPQQNPQDVKVSSQQNKQDKELKIRSQEKEKPAEIVGRPKPNQQPEDKLRQTRTEIKQQEVRGDAHVNNFLVGTHVQKKHIPDSAWTVNYQQQEALIKEIFPIFKNYKANDKSPPKPENTPQNYLSTMLHPVTSSPGANSSSNGSDVRQKNKIYPVYEREKTNNVIPDFFPANHRFSSPQEPSNGTAVPGGSAKPSFDKGSVVQLVFATAPTDDNRSVEESRKTTTTEPYEIVFSSSLLATTEATTKRPVIIVTPINSNKS